MIRLRYRVVSVVAVCLALAGGIALGAGPLQRPVQGQLAASDTDGEAVGADLRAAQREVAFADAYGARTARLVLGDALEGTRVALVLLPGADPLTVAGLRTQLDRAGAVPGRTVTVDATLLDPTRRGLAEGLARRTLGADAAGDASGYALVGAAMARAFLSDSAGGEDTDATSARVRAAFETADFWSLTGPDVRSASVLVVAGDPDATGVEGAADVAAEVVGAFARASRGTVAVGPTSAAEDDGVLAAVDTASDGARDGASTVDAADSVAGRLVSLLALVEQRAGGSGSYGATGADGPVPDLTTLR